MKTVVGVQTMRQSDASTIANGVSSKELMYRAGKGIFESYPWRGAVAIACGSGNNAGDGYVLALCLQEAKIPCTLVLLAEQFSPDGAYYFQKCRDVGIKTVIYSPDFSFSPYAEIVDCIFGTGFHGEVVGAAAELIRAINESGKTVISADINSGLDGENGMATLCVRSDLTVSIGSYKSGHFLGLAKDVIGSLCNVDIGIGIVGEAYCLMEQDDVKANFPPRRQSTHKGDYGYVSVMGGCTRYAGAVKLANMSCAALRAGCGVAQLIVPSSLVTAVSPYLLESTLFPFPERDGQMIFDPDAIDRALEKQKALAVGMGWGKSAEYARILEYILTEKSLSLVIDADGLNTLAQMPTELLKRTACKVILTPHLKEFERLSGHSIEQIQSDPIGIAKAYAKENGVCVLLKGACTVVSDGEDVYLIDRGCAGMATAGSGDVLSGILAGLLGFAPPNALTVACGAYVAGRAGELAQSAVGEYGMLASDTVSHISKAIQEITKA